MTRTELSKIVFEIVAHVLEGACDNGDTYEMAEVDGLSFDDRVEVTNMVRNFARKQAAKAGRYKKAKPDGVSLCAKPSPAWYHEGGAPGTRCVCCSQKRDDPKWEICALCYQGRCPLKEKK